jgi:hypothetical protein
MTTTIVASSPSISDLLKYADLQMAAEAFLTDSKRQWGHAFRQWGQVLPFAPNPTNLPRWQDLFALNSPARFIT